MIQRSEFQKLKTQLLDKAASILYGLDPEYVNEFKKALEEGRLLSHNPKENINTDKKFKVFKSICIAIVEIELQLHRIVVCLNLMAIKAPLALNEGEYLDYEYSCWSVLVQGLMSKFEGFASVICRKIILMDNAEFRVTIKPITELKKCLKRLRDPIVHLSDGPAQIISEPEHFGAYILINGDIEMVEILNQLSIFKEKWLEQAQKFTNIVNNNIETICQSINLRISKIDSSQ